MKITVHNKIISRTRDAVWKGLLKYNLCYAPRNQKDFTITVEDKNMVIGGAIGESEFGWMIVQYLWVNSRVRKQGIGSQIMSEVEKLAQSRKCTGIYLDTFSFQAPRFYKRLGYSKIGKLDDHPHGFSKMWFAKRLRS